MTGTPSRTATAYDDGTTRRSESSKNDTPRGCVGRQLQAKLRSEEYESHMRQSRVGRGRPRVQSPKVIRISSVVYVADVWSEGHASYPGRSVCLFDSKEAETEAVGVAVKEVPAGRGGMPRRRSERHASAFPRGRTREAARCAKGRQKSAESGSCQRTAA